jgi:hypothetical protein
MRHDDKFSHDNLFCEWTTGGPVILVWNRCLVNGRLVVQLSWFGTNALWRGQF